MCPAGMRIRVDMLLCPLIALEVHSESFHIGSTKTTRNGVSVCYDEASAWRTAFIMSSGSYSRFAMHEAVHRYRKKSSRPAKNGYFCTVRYIGEMGWEFGGLGKWGWEGVGLGMIWVMD